MVIFGGYNEASGSRNDVMTLSLAGTPTWTAIAPAGQLPNGRSLQSGVYDPVRDRLLIFGGGGDSGNFGDTWALNLGGAAIWTAVQAVGPAPSARAGHVAVYDPIRDGMVVFGGINGAYLNDTWRLGGTSAAWSSLVSAPLPISRQAHSAIYDSARDRVLIFGGYDGSHAFYNDVWALTLTGTPAWTPVSTTGTPPVAREGHTAIYDAARDRMVVFGGDDGVNSFNDAWSLALSGTPTWSPLLSVGTPPAARSGHSAIYDRSRGRMVVFGGNGIENDVWFLSLTSTPAWTRGDPTGVLPPPRYLHTAIADPARGRMIVFGGNDGVNSFNDVWALDLSGSAWTPLSPLGAPPNPRYLHGAIYDPVRDRMIVFGGWDGAERNSAWALTFAGTPSWSELAPGGNFPAPRLASSCVYSPVRDGMIVFGGSFGSINRNDAWALVWGAPIAGVVSPTVAALAIAGLHPNPAVDRLVVSFRLPNNSPARLELFDITGRMLASRDVENAGTGLREMDISQGLHLAAGVYSIRLRQGGQAAVARAVVMR
jgi:hypothetical protein